ncbi:hypothetical protein [Ferrovibrio xuzhouensis]|uniref:Uncharacterized protein n=1 Tax=Ferrovibrio xuzhouensis TaxID=1576914 RepID=A0ABV7VDY3_9PROT
MQDRLDPTMTMQALATQALGERALAAQTAVILPVRLDHTQWSEEEPALSDMLADPITQLLMRRDGVQEAEIRRLAARLRDSSERRSSARGRRPANDLVLDQPL